MILSLPTLKDERKNSRKNITAMNWGFKLKLVVRGKKYFISKLNWGICAKINDFKNLGKGFLRKKSLTMQKNCNFPRKICVYDAQSD
jgi:hypothetical protein